jgi:predicted DCC family thiol-disulfide oxidoreductase YuxK
MAKLHYTAFMTSFESANRTNSVAPEVVVYFDGSCPMCSKEIQYYKGLDKDSRILWENVAGDNPSCPIGYDQATLMQRFHVKDMTTGEVLHGAAGFARVWCALPSPWRVLGKIASLAPVTWVLERGYRLTLKLRPMIARRFFGGR